MPIEKSMERVGTFVAVICVVCAVLWSVEARPAEPAAPAGKELDLQGLIDARVRAGERRVILPPGRWRVAPRHGRHLSMKDLADLEIVANGVEMRCTQTMPALVFENCRNVRFSGMTIDYDPLPFTEARITALGADKRWIDFKLLEGYPENELEQRVEIYDPATGELRRTDGPWEKQFTQLGPRQYRIAKRAGYRYNEEVDAEQVGDILVTNNRFPERSGGHAVVVQNCAGLTLENVTLYASPCFGFLEHHCDGSSYVRCRIDRRPAADDPVRRAFPRMRSLNADAFHSVEATKGPAILNCVAKFQGDDCVNIHGTYHFVAASQGSQLRVAALGRMTILPGDPVEFLPYEGAKPADAKAVAVEPDSPITEQEKAFIAKLHMNDNNRQRLLEGKAVFHKLTLDRAVPLPMGSAVAATNRIGSGFQVKGCDFGYNRSRAILIKASRGEVSGNTITNGWMAAVLVSPEFWWFEAGSSNAVVIRDNTIVGCRRGAIEVVAPGGNGKPLPCGAHQDIVIAGNTIQDSVWPNIRVGSTKNLTLRDNRLTPRDPGESVPPGRPRQRWGNAKPAQVVIESCDENK